MPTYDYQCEQGHTFEVTHGIFDPPPTQCSQCESKIKKLLSPPTIRFNGAGFYTTDKGKN